MELLARLAALSFALLLVAATDAQQPEFSAKAEVGGHQVVSGKAGNFSLSSSSLSFSAMSGLATPAAQMVSMRVTGSGVKQVGAGFIEANPGWLTVSIVPLTSKKNNKDYRLTIGVTGTWLSPGTYTTTLSVGTANKKGKILKISNIAVTYRIEPRIALTGIDGSQAFVYGSSTHSRMLSLGVTAPSRSWTASSDQPWLTVSPAPRSGSGEVSMAVETAGLAPGGHTAQVTVANAAVAADQQVATVTIYVVPPTLTVLQSEIALGGSDGSSLAPAELGFSIDTGSAGHPWILAFSADDGDGWLSLGAGGGTVDEGGATVALTALRAAVDPGTHTGTLTLSVSVGDLSFAESLPVTFNVEEHRLVVGTAGVGLSSTPARSVLQRTIAIDSSLDRDGVPWQASSDQPWLQVTAAGVTGGSLQLTADPSGLADATTHFATVTVVSSADDVSNIQTIRVGLYVDAAAVADVSVPAAMKHLVASPVEPLVFVNDGASTIKAINVYTGVVERTFTGVAGGVGTMVMSDDGTRLYLYDRNNLRVRELDATAGTVLRNFDSPVLFGENPYGGGLAFIRPDGHGMIVTPSSLAYDVETGVAHRSASFAMPVFATAISVAPDGQRMVEEGGAVYTVDRSALHGGAFRAALEFYTGTAGGAPGQACFRGDGAVVYTASGWPYEFPGVSVTTHQRVQTLPGSPYPNAVVCSWNGLVVGGLDTGPLADGDVWVYDGNQGALLALRRSSETGVQALVRRGLAISADGVRVISLGGNPDPYTSSTTSGAVWLQTVPAPAP